MSPLCFRAGHELEKGWGWWLPFWVIPCSTCTHDVWKHARIFVAKFLKFSQQRKATTTWTCYFCILTCLLSHFCFPHNMWLVASAVPSAEMAIQLCPKSFFKTEKQNHSGMPHLDNDYMQRAGNVSDVTSPHFHAGWRAQTCKAQCFLLEWAKVSQLHFTSVICTTSYCQVQSVSLKWDLFSLPGAIWQISDWTKLSVQLFLPNARGLLVPVWGYLFILSSHVFQCKNEKWAVINDSLDQVA